MFSSSFLESTKTYSKADPLLLPEDSPKAFQTICEMLHYKPTSELDITEISQLAVLADKYQCTSSIGRFVTSQLGQLFAPHVTDHILPERQVTIDVMGIAWVLNDHLLFSRSTAHFVAHYRVKNILQEAPESLVERLPNDISGRLQVSNSTIRQLADFHAARLEALQSQANRTMSQELINCDIEACKVGNRIPHEPCPGTIKTVGRYRLMLTSCESSHHPVIKKHSPLSDNWLNVRSLASYQAKLHGAEACPGLESEQKKGKRCSTCPTSLRDSILKIIDNSQKTMEGLCLDCERSDPIPTVSLRCDHRTAVLGQTS